MDFESSSKFISSLAKFLQSLCNGYVEFNSGVEVIGHIYLSVDTGKKIDYILNEKVCKTDENSVTFISNSFHAQPAEKPKPPTKPSSEPPSRLAESTVKGDDEEIIIMDEPESKNTGTVLSRDSFKQLHTSQQPKAGRPSKRSFNQSFPSSQKHSAKQSRSDFSGPTSSQIDSDSSLPENNTSNFIPPHLTNDATLMAASESDITHLSKVFPQNFNDSITSHSAGEERDIKPQLDSEMKVVQVKQEYEHAEHVGEEDQDSYDDSHDQGAYPSMPYDPYCVDGSRRGPRSDYSHIAGLSQGDYIQGSSSSGEALAGDSSVHSFRSHGGKRELHQMPSSTSSLNFSHNSLKMSHPSASTLMLAQAHPQQDIFIKERKRMNFECEVCGKRLPSRREYVGHMNGRHLGQKPFSCELCGRQFAYITSLPMHRKTCPAAQLARLNPTVPLSKASGRSAARMSVSADGFSTYQVNNNDNSLVDTSTFSSSDIPGSLSFNISLPPEPSSSSSTGNELNTDI